MESNDVSEILKAAQIYVARNWRVIPLRPNDKKPFLDEWQSLPMPDAAQLTQWFGNGSGYGIGIVCSHDLVVVDIDPRHGGIESFEKITGQSIEDIETPTQVTPHDGFHLLFKNSDPNRIVKNWTGIYPGIDVRTEGGQIAAYPTVIDGKTYRWIKPASKYELQELPEWVKEKPKTRKVELVNEGSRNTDATKVAGALRRVGLDTEQIASALRPITTLDDDEVRTIAESVGKYDAAESSIIVGETKSMREWLANPPPMPTWLVDGLLTDGGISIIAAKPKVGKSTLARNLAADVSMRRAFLGHAIRADARPVLYFGLEDMPGIVTEHLQLLGMDLDRLIFSNVQVPADQWAFLRTEIERYKPSLVILDPYARFLRIRKWEDYGEVTEKTQPLIALTREYGCHITGTHHMRKGGGSEDMDEILGSAQVQGFVDTAIALNRLFDDRRTIKTMQRYGSELPTTFLDFAFDAKRFSLGRVRRDEQIEDDIRKLVDAMQEGLPYTADAEALKSAVAMRASRLAALKEGSENHPQAFVRTGEGRKGNPYFYTLAPNAVESIEI